MKDAPICNAGVLGSQHTVNVIVEYSESSKAEYRQYNVLNPPRKRRRKILNSMGVYHDVSIQ